jgi:N-hydroxyarylamine O-acetyltransferase
MDQRGISMQAGFDLDGYFERIGYAGSGAATLETLEALHLRHAATIPFENLNPLLRWPVRLDEHSLQQKLVRDGRGGYCFEQNLLFSHALKQLGFRVTGLAARVLWGIPDLTVTARSHMLLRIDLDDGPYIADVGFGGLTLTAPLRLEADVEQPTPHEPFRLSGAREAFVLQAKINGTWKSLYRFTLEEQFLVDYEAMSWYLSNNPASHFVTGLIAARPDRDRRYALRDNTFAVHHLSGATERRVLASASELRATLEDAFHLTLPDGPELDAGLARLTAAPRA